MDGKKIIGVEKEKGVNRLRMTRNFESGTQDKPSKGFGTRQPSKHKICIVRKVYVVIDDADRMCGSNLDEFLSL